LINLIYGGHSRYLSNKAHKENVMQQIKANENIKAHEDIIKEEQKIQV